jgi:hypothetical protein
MGMGMLEVIQMYFLETLSLFPRVETIVHKEDLVHIRQHLRIKKSTYGEVTQKIHLWRSCTTDSLHINNLNSDKFSLFVKFLKMNNDSFTSHFNP